jgi:hypothetical protein
MTFTCGVNCKEKCTGTQLALPTFSNKKEGMLLLQFQLKNFSWFFRNTFEDVRRVLGPPVTTLSIFCNTLLILPHCLMPQNEAGISVVVLSKISRVPLPELTD